MAETFGKTEETLNEEVKEIRRWLETQSHLPEVMGESLVKNFYLLNKCRMEKTKEKIDNYYTVRSHYRDIFDTINPKCPNMQLFMKTIYFIPLPKMAEDMYRVLVWKVRDPCKLKDSDPYDMIRHFVNVMEISLHEDSGNGIITVVDASNLHMKFLLRITPVFLYKFLIVIFERIYSFRFKAVYLFNCPSFVEKLIGLVKKMLKPKLANRFYMYKDLKDVQEKVSLDILPEELGGTCGTLEEIQTDFQKKLEEYQDRYDKLDQFRVDEKLRPMKDKSIR